MCVCVRERERGLQLHFGSGCLSPLIGFFYQRRHSKACELKSTVFPSSFTLRVLTISNFDSYIYIYIYSYTCGHCAPNSVLKIPSSKTTLILILVWYSTYLILLSLDFTSHFERFTKEIFTLLISWTATLYGSYNIHHYYYYYL